MSSRQTLLVEHTAPAGYVVPAPMRGDMLRMTLQNAFHATPCEYAPFQDLIHCIDEADRARS